MRIGYAWLIAGVTLLASPSSLLAQAVPPDAAPGAAPSATGSPLPGVQGAFTPPPPIRPGQAISVLVFPFGFAGGADPAAAPAAPAEPAAPGEAPAPGAESAAAGSALAPEQQEVINYLTAAVKAGFLSTPAYSVASYHPQSALIQRARKDEILRPEHIQDLVSPTGAVDLEKARTVAYRLGMQSVLVGTIDMSTDAATRNVEITLEAQLVDSVTGKPLKTAAVGGAAAGAEGVPVLAIQERAAQEAAQRMLPAMGIQLVQPRKNDDGPATAPRVKAGKQSASERKAAQAAAKAEREATAKAREAAKAAEKQRKKDEEAAKKAGKTSGKSAPVKPAAQPASVAPAPEAPVKPAAQPAAPAPQPAVPAAPATEQPAAPAVSGIGNPGATVQGVADEAGRPIPYGYAISKQDAAGLPRRERSGLRVPPWLGLVGFLTGVSFLLY